ncbi:HesB/IscA family protein [Saccharibacillus qingshengii]|uniref:HesB/IscA family protein n=1 Tax=Saccharibacillus qingshengii TaxID=1763540 RepID=UPI001554F14C|nr:iron-sulfur cluster assembly accessory protein [Saccharibacillus qingshengii]
MKVKITRNAAKKLLEELNKEENKDMNIRVFVTHSHGDHAHYGMDLDKQKDGDERVSTDKDIDVLVDASEPMLDGIKIDYLYSAQEEGFVITNPAMGNHGDH